MSQTGSPWSISKASIMDWRFGSSSRALALEVQSPEFKPQCHQKKKKIKILYTTEATVQRMRIQDTRHGVKKKHLKKICLIKDYI
jgi:hypothetical protein